MIHPGSCVIALGAVLSIYPAEWDGRTYDRCQGRAHSALRCVPDEPRPPSRCLEFQIRGASPARGSPPTVVHIIPTLPSQELTITGYEVSHLRKAICMRAYYCDVARTWTGIIERNILLHRQREYLLLSVGCCVRILPNMLAGNHMLNYAEGAELHS